MNTFCNNVFKRSALTLGLSFPDKILSLDFFTGNTSSMRVSMYLGFLNKPGFLNPLPKALFKHIKIRTLRESVIASYTNKRHE